MKKSTTTLIALAGLGGAALAFPAAAQMRTPAMSSFYVGANLGQSKFKLECAAGESCDDKDTAFKLFAGYQFHPNFAAEFGYTDLGKAKFSDPLGSAELKASAWELSALGLFPVMPSLQLFGRLGVYNGKTEFSGDASGSKSKTGVTWGLGGEWDFTRNLGARLEWQRFTKMKANCDGCGGESEGDVDNLSIGIVYRFQ
jgi:OmpA-OmpF porin, OOP family